MNTVVAGGVPKRRGTVMVLGAVKHDVLSILLYHGRIKCPCGFEPLAAGRQNRVERKPRPLSKKRSKWNGGNGGENDEKHPRADSCPCSARCNRGDLYHCRNSFPY